MLFRARILRKPNCLPVTDGGAVAFYSPLMRAHGRAASDDNPPLVVPGFFIDWLQRLECTRSLAETKEPGARPMCPGDPLGNHGQRPIALALVFEPVLAHEDGMGASSPLPHQGRPGLQHYVGIERTSAFLEFSCQNLQPALQCAARAAMGALLQLIREPLMIRSRLRPRGGPV